MKIDDPDVVAEVKAAFLAYENALIAQRFAELDASFWTDPRVVRYGIAEIQYGAPAIAEWRRGSPHVGDDRTLRNTIVSAFGNDYAIVATEFFRPDSAAVGRQSQAWVRLDQGWTVVHAHVSVVEEAYVERAGEPAGAGKRQ